MLIDILLHTVVEMTTFIFNDPYSLYEYITNKMLDLLEIYSLMFVKSIISETYMGHFVGIIVVRNISKTSKETM